MPLGKQKIDRRFPAHIPMEPTDVVRKNTLSELYRDFATYLDGSLSDGRLKSLAMTKLEESHMFTLKSMDQDVDSARLLNEESNDDGEIRKDNE